MEMNDKGVKAGYEDVGALSPFFVMAVAITKNAPRGSHCGGMVDVANATRRSRRILRSRILFFMRRIT